ncbi:hypothetical protein C2845_PM07G02700 [Panicum miliaceum]|uniref:RING-type E3 ubiquitin transferase n=1 Tax=Panicum miliaceum TaxID=4540 RepID=A0A3L6SLA9_PANMI|nr:hypothetical protein C2845_PM07G02700 [Panicum miliaceum]
MEGKDSEERGRERRQHKDDDEASSSAKRRKPTATAVDMALEVLDCTVCYSPLKPPVFQCAVGHVVCSCCRAKLPGDRCHMCSAGPATTCYNRCHAVEHILESIRVPCAHTGCAARTAYHDREAHEAACPHAPCFCRSPAAHLVSLHGWPCSAFRFDEPLAVPVAAMWGAVVRVQHDGGCGRRAFFLLLVMRPAGALGIAVSALCVEPRRAPPRRRGSSAA